MSFSKSLARFGLIFLFLPAGCGSRPTPRQATPHPLPAEETLPATAGNAPERPSPQPARPETKAQPEPPKTDLPEAVTKTFPDARYIRRRDAPFPVEVVLGSRKAVLGYSAWSDSAGTTARGYAGPVPVHVLLDAQARPKRIYLLDNQETPAYLELAVNQGILERLLDYDPARPDSIDAVTLATMSSKAVVASVTRTADRVAREVVGR
jgi:uncharacterized protein with FMN-binding domain